METSSIKREIFKILIWLISSYVVGVCLNIGVSNKSDLITFLSIMVGFFMTALSLLFSSPLYKVLQKRDREGYPNKWIEIVDKYSIATIFSIISVLVLLINIKVHPFYILRFKIIVQVSKIYFSITTVSIYLFIDISLVLFKNLKFPIN
ncbi:hypothetical protein [Lactobacillus intestinalis]|uniref:hypothetical protein n=1 Tax=Lactobacillus intestinalis TaxID=151781 RepID=UPI00242CA70D|nr:hypothetical protein [Lactobacillus intestinalis]